MQDAVGDLAFCLGYEPVVCEQSQCYFILVILWLLIGVFEECEWIEVESLFDTGTVLCDRY